jgi:hypothetical protein
MARNGHPSTLIQNRNDKQAEIASPILARLGNIYKAVVVTETLAGEYPT